MEKSFRPAASLTLFHLSAGKVKSMITTQKARCSLFPDILIQTFPSFFFFLLFLHLLKFEHDYLIGSAQMLPSICIAVYILLKPLYFMSNFGIFREKFCLQPMQCTNVQGIYIPSTGYHCLSKNVPRKDGILQYSVTFHL